MPVDQETLNRYITEVAGEDAELATMLRDKFGTKQDAATRFVGGFLRHSDYTSKTQDLTKQRQQFESVQNEYEQKLTQAEADKDQIMKDLASERITAAKASSLLKTVKQAYGLTDNDLPGIDDINTTARTGKVVDSTPDIDERLKSFEEKLMDRVTKQLIPEISGLAMLGPVWNEIGHEHEQLFNKRLTKKDTAEILKQAREENRSLESVWQDKYGVQDKRLEVRDSSNREKWKQEWEDEQAKRNQEAALEGVRSGAKDFVLEGQQSPMFKRSFAPREEPDGNSGNTGSGNPPPTPRPVQGDAARERMGGAERAAAKFMERRANGQIGQPIPEKRIPA